ncbi:MAG: hypothetical protein GXP49_01475 [Deltaproteobacteria bacterium]|nr:hypothetical protein [Deltaproteobacteria bacterium]
MIRKSLFFLLLVVAAGQAGLGLCKDKGLFVIEQGREAEIQSLFEPFYSKDSKWKVDSIQIPFDRIHATLRGPAGSSLVLELLGRGQGRNAVALSKSFDFILSGYNNISEDEAMLVAVHIAAVIGKRDKGGFFRKKVETIQAIRGGASWFSSTAGLSSILWVAGMAVLSALFFISLILNRGSGRAIFTPWTGIALIAVIAAAFIARWFMATHGPANFYSHLPCLSRPPIDLQGYGPGYFGWILPWFLALGQSDRTAFLAGAIAGTVTVLPVYIIGKELFQSRFAGLAAAACLALWPIHARLSPTDDPWIVVGLLLATSLASAMAGIEHKSGVLLVAAWLSSALACATRPEAALSVVFLGLFILSSKKGQRLQRKPLVIAGTILAMAPALVSVWWTGSRACSYFPFWRSLAPWSLARLFGLHKGSVLFPDRTPLSFLLVLAIGSILWIVLPGGHGNKAGKEKRTILLILLFGLAPAIPTASLAGPGLVTARYQVPLVIMAAVIIGGILCKLNNMVGFRAPSMLSPGNLVLAGLVSAGLLNLGAHRPQPTFRSEYEFFRDNIEKVPKGCRILEVQWRQDLGLAPPKRFSCFLGLKHKWIRAASLPKPGKKCLVYWRPGACSVDYKGAKDIHDTPAYQCDLIEKRYELEPMAQEIITARPGFNEHYIGAAENKVRIGFYYVRAVAGGPSSFLNQGASGHGLKKIVSRFFLSRP